MNLTTPQILGFVALTLAIVVVAILVSRLDAGIERSQEGRREPSEKEERAGVDARTTPRHETARGRTRRKHGR